MSFESTAEGRVGVDGADRWRKTVPHVGTRDGDNSKSWRRILMNFLEGVGCATSNNFGGYPDDDADTAN